MSDWQPWLICPVEGYLETGALGPVPVVGVDWLDISNVNRDGNDHTEVIAKLLLDVGAHFTHNADTLRVTPQAPNNESPAGAFGTPSLLLQAASHGESTAARRWLPAVSGVQNCWPP
jgi:hypothetical protein